MSVEYTTWDSGLYYNLLVDYLKPVFSPKSDELNILHVGLNMREEDVSVNKFLSEHYSRNVCPWTGDVFTSALNIIPISHPALRVNGGLFGSEGDATKELTYQKLELLNERKDYDLIIIRAQAPGKLKQTLQMYDLAISHLRFGGCLFSTSAFKDENSFFEELVEKLDHPTTIYSENPLCEEIKHLTDCKIAVWKNNG